MERRLVPQPHDECGRRRQTNIRAHPEPLLELCTRHHRGADSHNNREAHQADERVREAESLRLRGAHHRAAAEQGVDIADRGVAGINVNLQALIHQNRRRNECNQAGANQPESELSV